MGGWAEGDGGAVEVNFGENGKRARGKEQENFG
jgi:hypothetical protein